MKKVLTTITIVLATLLTGCTDVSNIKIGEGDLTIKLDPGMELLSVSMSSDNYLNWLLKKRLPGEKIDTLYYKGIRGNISSSQGQIIFIEQ